MFVVVVLVVVVVVVLFVSALVYLQTLWSVDTCDCVHHNQSNVKMGLIPAHLDAGVILVVTVQR